MKAYQLKQPGSLNGLMQTDLLEPTPGPGEVLVRVHAVSLNYRDLMIVLGQYGRASDLPANLTPLSDGAGQVVAMGDGVTRVAVGDRVAGIFFQTWLHGSIRAAYHASALGGAINGMLAEYVVLSQDGIVKLPDFLTYDEGAALPCAAVTAWNGLVEQGQLAAGETVLLLGTGGVSMFGLQIAKAHGARVIITSSSDEKLARAKSLGADEMINYRTTSDWEKVVWSLTGKQGVDHVLEVGGPGTFAKSLQALRHGGHLAQIGVLSDPAATVSPLPILGKSLRIDGIYVGSRAMFERLLNALAVSQIRPIIDRTFVFEETHAAYAYLQSGAHFGKIVIRVA
jgi:NADPH:quinone reductase-like Zn-dependent oxidoreductase